MKSVFSPLLIAMLIFSAFGVGLLQGCKISKPASGSHLRIRIPLDDGNNNYTFHEVTLDSVTNLSTMAGPVVRFKAHGGLFSKAQGASSINEGNDPTARFIEDGDGVYVATDQAALTMASAYYHFEKIKAFFDQWGENRDLKFPRLVMIEPDYLDVDSGFGVMLPPTNNGMYNPTFDVFIITKRDDKSSPQLVPVAFNGGILAHEYSHAIFNRYVLRNISGVSLTENSITKLNRFYMKAIDEGVADFFGALYSGNPNFNAATYGPEQATIRNMQDFKGLNENPKEVRDRMALGDTMDPHLFGAKIASFLWKLKGEWNSPATASIVWGAVDRYMKTSFSKFDQQSFGFVDFVTSVVEAKQNFEGQVSKISYSPEKDCSFGKQFLGQFGSESVICDPLSAPEVTK